MATYAAKLRKTAIANGSIRLNSQGQISGGGVMEPFSSRGLDSIFYVDGNVVSGGDGRTWETAFKTLAAGLAAAHSYMSTSANRAWAHRATVFCCGDNLEENLVLGAEKTDVIGVGSSAGYTKCYLDGLHVPATTNTWGMRWFNMAFGSTTQGVLFTLTSISGGMEFHDCIFSSRGPAHTIAVKATAVGSLKIHDCKFEAAPADFSTAGIDILAGDAAQTEIMRSYIVGAVGIRINASTTTTAGNILINDCVIKSSGETINDASSLAVVTNCRLITATNTTTVTAGYTGNQYLWANNVLTGASTCDEIPYRAQS